MAKRSTFKQPAQWLLDAFGATPTVSGESVSEESALKVAAVYALTCTIANAMKVLPLNVYKTRPGGGKDKQTNHNAQWLLHHEPNPEMTPSQFKGVMQVWASLYSSAYAIIQSKPGGGSIALWPVHPTSVVIHRRNDTGPLEYIVRLPDQSQMAVPFEQMIQIYGMSTDGVNGHSTIRQGREAIGAALAMEKFGAAFFGNNARPATILKHPQSVGDEGVAALRKSWQDMYGGAANAGKTAILEEGMDVVTIGTDPEKAQALETRVFIVQELARLFKVPPHKIAELSHATYTNIEHQAIEFYTDTVHPWCVTWEEELTRKLLSPDERRAGVYVKFGMNAILRADAKTRSEFYGKALTMGWMSPDEVRELEEMNPMPDGLGKEFFMQGAMKTVAKIVEGKEAPAPVPPVPPAEPEEPEEEKEPEEDEDEEKKSRSLDNAYRPLFRDAYGRIIHKEVDRLRRATRKHKPDVAAFAEWVKEFYANGHASYVSETLTPLWYSYDAIRGVPSDARETATHFIGSSRGQILGLIRDNPGSEVWELLEGRFAEWLESRADTCAESEVGNGSLS
ncbi:MAG: phage portal protein [Phycisphaerae bacterium]|nr:phage portal protein [Phycisphaerae bacterium]